MADTISDGMTRVTWMLTCSSAAAPTAAEINAGVALESYITPDGLDIATTTAVVDAGSLASTQDQELPGRRKDSITLTLKSQGWAAAPYTTFAARPAGFLVVRRGIATATAFTAAQTVLVYPSKAGDRQQIPAAPNEVEKFSVPFFVTSPAQDAATVA